MKILNNIDIVIQISDTSITFIKKKKITEYMPIIKKKGNNVFRLDYHLQDI